MDSHSQRSGVKKKHHHGTESTAQKAPKKRGKKEKL